MKEKISEMLALQDTLNTNTNNNKWRYGITPNGKIINWKRCIYMELAEAIDSISWKHWKNVEGGIDIENFRVEMIDIWHFVMSYILVYNDTHTLVDIISKYVDTDYPTKLPKQLNKETNLKIDEFLLVYENMMSLSLEKDNSSEYQEKLIKTFFECLSRAYISFDDLYKLYIGKNVLNKFRQDHGYKEGTYIKIWNNKEDNVYMQEIINTTTGFDNIYESLEKIYNTL